MKRTLGCCCAAALLLALPATGTFGPVVWSADGGGVSATFGGATFRAASAAPTTVLARTEDLSLIHI